MAEISYQRTFEHQDWIDNEDVVQAEGENGFNVRFHALENELDRIGETIGQVAEVVERGLGARPVITLAIQLGANEVSDPEEIDLYDNADYPGGARRLYQVVIEPFGSFHGQASHHFLYSSAAADQTQVRIWFKNERSEVARFSARIFALN
jgi:hypothetical protein